MKVFRDAASDNASRYGREIEFARVRLAEADLSSFEPIMCLSAKFNLGSQYLFRVHGTVMRYPLGYLIKRGKKIEEAIKAGKPSKRNFVTLD